MTAAFVLQVCFAILLGIALAERGYTIDRWQTWLLSFFWNGVFAVAVALCGGLL
jgi:hypothetical protein